MAEPDVFRMRPGVLSMASFSPYGTYAAMPDRRPDWAAAGSRLSGVNEEGVASGHLVAELWNLADIPFHGDQPYLGYVRYHWQGFRVAELERHRMESQCWLACAGASFLVVAGASDEPLPQAAVAFLVQAGDVISIRAEVWMCHFLPVGPVSEHVVITGRRHPEQDREVVNFIATSNTILEVSLTA